MLDSRGKTKGGWFFILGFNMLKPNMSNTISIGTCSSDLYIDYFFETSGTASCGTTGRYTLPKFNMEHENGTLESEIPFWKPSFLASTIHLGSVHTHS